MKINVKRLLSPDFTLGKILVTMRALIDILRLFFQNPSKESVIFAALILKVKPKFTMVRNRNLINLYRLVEEVNRYDLPGDIVECGVWNGGSAAIMGVADRQGLYPKSRMIWLFDSFQGLPRPSEKDGAIEKRDFFEKWNMGDMEKVKQIFTQLGLGLDQVEIIPGWFESTLKAAAIDSIAVLHIDADWYHSVKTVLEAFYEKVVPGGFIVLDDYGYWEGCAKALRDFLSEQAVEGVVIRQIDKGGAFFQKPVRNNRFKSVV